MARKSTWLVVVLWLLVAAEIGVEKCRGLEEGVVQDVMDNASEVTEGANLDEKVEVIKKGASEVYNDFKDSAESWSNWAYDKISKGLGLNEEELKETAHYVVDKAGDAATKTTQKINTVASDASEKAGEAVKAASEAAGSLKSKSENAIGSASEKAGDMTTKAKESLVNGKEKATEAYEAGKNEMEQKFGAAKEKEKENSETVKEKASQTAGEIGARIREKTAEL